MCKRHRVSEYTRPLRTILNLIEADTVERVFLRQALGQAIHRGLITRQQIKTAKAEWFSPKSI